MQGGTQCLVELTHDTLLDFDCPVLGGFAYLKFLVVHRLENEKDIYPCLTQDLKLVARQNNTTYGAVERALRTLAKIWFETKDGAELFKARPTIKNMVIRACELVRDGQNPETIVCGDGSDDDWRLSTFSKLYA